MKKKKCHQEYNVNFMSDYSKAFLIFMQETYFWKLSIFVIFDMESLLKTQKSLQHWVFPGGHPSKY